MKRESRTPKQLFNKMLLQAKILQVDLTCGNCKHYIDHRGLFNNKRYWQSSGGYARKCKVYKSFPYHYKIHACYGWNENRQNKIYTHLSDNRSYGWSRSSTRICKRWVGAKKK